MKKQMMPAFEVMIKRDTTYFNIAWNACKQPLQTYDYNYMETTETIKPQDRL